MGNAFASDVAPEQRGVIPRVIKDVGDVVLVFVAISGLTTVIFFFSGV
jgi:hypothetical protein